MISHIALFCVLLPCVCGCGNECMDIRDTPQPALSTRLSLDITLPALTGEEDIPVRERVKELRLIMIDDGSDKVEFNKVLDLSSLSVSKDSKYRYTYHVEIESKTGSKTLYALANAEDLIQGIVSSTTSGKALVNALENAEIPSDFYDQTGNHIPIVSRAYKASLTAAEEKTEVSMVLAYVATKFDFTFTNKLESKENVKIVGWDIRQEAQRSYLVPHMTDKAWEGLIGLGGSVDSREWITDYEVPENTEYVGYRWTYPSSTPLPHGSTWTDPETYYLHESKYFPPEEGGKEQKYYFSLRIRLQDASESSLPLVLQGKNFGHLPNLQSLVRGTHVKVNATLTKLPEAGDNSLEVRVKTWIVDDPIDGGWEEVPQN